MVDGIRTHHKQLRRRAKTAAAAGGEAIKKNRHAPIELPGPSRKVQARGQENYLTLNEEIIIDEWCR